MGCLWLETSLLPSRLETSLLPSSSSCEFESCSWRGVLDTTVCDKVCQWLSTGQWFSLGNPISPINKTDSHDITEIMLKVALNTRAEL
jgi:hypothetical protein